MKKNVESIIKLAILVITILYNTPTLSAEYVKKIIIQGNNRIEDLTIESYLKIRVGSEYTAFKGNEAIKSLYATSLFKSVGVKLIDDGSLVVVVSENPLITRIVFKGNLKIRSSILIQELLSMSGESMSSAKIQLDVKKIREIYKRAGRFSTIVTPKVEQLQNNRVQVTFDIAEGPKTAIKYIYFSGNNNYRNNELESVILTKQSKWFNFLETNDVYDPDRLEYDKELLKAFYQSVGFADFRVISVTAELNPTREYFTVTYSIEEGPKYNFGSITIDSKLPNVSINEIKKYIDVKSNSAFNMDSLNRIARKISSHLASQGYPGISVYHDISSRNFDYTVDVKFTINKADKIFINQINIVNNLKTEDQVIRREFKISEGDVFNRSYIEKGDRNLRNLDYFEKVLISVIPTKRKDKYDINIDIEEKSTSYLSFDAGYNTAGGLFGRVSFLERNLIGTGKILNTGLQVDRKSTSYYGGITDPHFLDRDLLLGFNVFKNDSGRGSSFISQGEQNYALKSIGLRTSLGYDIAEDLSHDIDYTIKRDVLSSPGNSCCILLTEQIGKFITSSIRHTVTYDHLDNRIVPKNGYTISGTQEFAGIGGNNKYLKHELDSKYFRSFIQNKLTLKLASAIGNIRSVAGKNIRIADRFSLGDYGLRGFSSSGVGPREKRTNECLGGEKFYTLSTEFNFPIGLPKDFNVTGAAFIDVGSLWGVELNSKSTYIPDSFHNDKSLRISVGVGFMWITHFAPIRMDWAWPIRKKHYDDTQHFHLKFSTHF